MKTKKEILDKVWEDLDKTRMTSQISNDLISDVVDSVLKAINYTRCCDKLKDKEVPNFEDWKEEYFEHRPNVYIDYGSGNIYSNEDVIKEYNNIYKQSL